jgi:hypothetical protein
MRGRHATVCPSFLLLALACLCVVNAHARQASAQEWPVNGSPNQQADTTRKIDEYGKIGHCDETARLDNFAIELQNEPGSKGYLVVYVGKDDLPSWMKGIRERAADYLVNSRGLKPERIEVINGGYREKRETELWIIPENDPPPQPSNTIKFELDRTKSYKWDEDSFNIEFGYDDAEAVESEDAEAADSEEAEGEVVAAADAAQTSGEEAEAERAREAELKKKIEKYEISTVVRGVAEDESEPEDSGAAETETGDGAANKTAVDGEASAEPEDAPSIANVTISLWWNVEALADELKAVPDARLCLVYYWGVKNATQERVKELVERALVKTEEQLGVKRDRIILVDGGRSPDPGLELWVVPRGAETPRPRPEQRRNFGFYSSPGEE